MRFLKRYYLYIIFILLGFAAGALYFGIPSNKSKPSASGEKCSYSLINPLRCGENQPEQVEYTVFKKELLEELEKEKKLGKISNASLYFRDLSNGPTFYFNEQEDFAPMSLLKLPTMVAVYKTVEYNPELLKEKLRTPMGFAQNSQVMDAEKTLKPNTEYTLDELISYMIVYSDNRATDMLVAWLETKGTNLEIIRRTMSDLGIVGYEADLNNTKITVKQYASIFRILYNSSYLNPEMSERALAILEESEFADGLTGELSSDIKVAHKFGVRAYVEGEQQLHDCGIVYFKPSPYMLCIMTRGVNYADLSSYIKKTSKAVFEEVKERSE